MLFLFQFRILILPIKYFRTIRTCLIDFDVQFDFASEAGRKSLHVGVLALIMFNFY